MFYAIGEAALALGVSISSLRRWEKQGKIRPSFRTPGGHRRFALNQLEQFAPGRFSSAQQRTSYAYARVSSAGQKDDLVRQKERLRNHLSQQGKPFILLEDLGSGLNYQKPGLKRLLRDIFLGRVSTLTLTHEDRLLRFGSELIFSFCRHFGTEVILLEEKKNIGFEEELVADVIQIITVFTAKLYGKRAHEHRKERLAS